MNSTDDKVNEALEREFRTLVETVGKQIAEKVSAANALLAEACQLADDHGLPFYSPGISQLGQNYVPNSFSEKFSDLPQELVEELTSVSEYKLSDAYGWEASMVCW